MTSRLSYTSAAESDGEFCTEDTPRRSAALNNAEPRLARTASDPSLARQTGTIKSEPGDIPDYSAAPPYSTQPDPGGAAQPGQASTKRRSHGGDSKYGFPNKQEQPGYSSGVFRSQTGDRYAAAPADQADSKRSHSQPPNVLNNKNKKEAAGPNGSVPVLPPKIDRQKKPSKKSAAERLFGRSEDKADEESPVGGESDDSPPENRNGGFHSMPPISVAENNKKNTFDSNSSSNFDSYNKHAESGYAAYSRSLSQGGATNGHASYSGPASGKFSGPPGPPGPDKFR